MDNVAISNNIKHLWPLLILLNKCLILYFFLFYGFKVALCILDIKALQKYEMSQMQKYQLYKTWLALTS